MRSLGVFRAVEVAIPVDRMRTCLSILCAAQGSALMLGHLAVGPLNEDSRVAGPYKVMCNGDVAVSVLA